MDLKDSLDGFQLLEVGAPTVTHRLAKVVTIFVSLVYAVEKIALFYFGFNSRMCFVRSRDSRKNKVGACLPSMITRFPRG
jgi:hypothetical protein